MTYETITLQTDARGVATLTLNMPSIHNAMSGKMISELATAVEAIESDTDIRVVVLTGEGKSFCAGGDLEWMRAQFEADRATRIAETLKLANMLFAMNALSKPLIGKIQGQAFGGGIGMMSVCDVAIGVDTAKFGLTETKLGLIPATISPYVIARMGEAMARRVFMSSRIFDAQEAVSLGLLAKAVSGDELDQEVEQEVRPYLQTAPGAVAKAKKLTARFGSNITQEDIQYTAEQLADCWESDETQEGINAFFAKEKPSWQKEG